MIKIGADPKSEILGFQTACCARMVRAVNFLPELISAKCLHGGRKTQAGGRTPAGTFRSDLFLNIQICDGITVNQAFCHKAAQPASGA
jgi:hypothetical protein